MAQYTDALRLFETRRAKYSGTPAYNMVEREYTSKMHHPYRIAIASESDSDTDPFPPNEENHYAIALARHFQKHDEARQKREKRNADVLRDELLETERLKKHKQLVYSQNIKHNLLGEQLELRAQQVAAELSQKPDKVRQRQKKRNALRNKPLERTTELSRRATSRP
jgi:hypothetical protein